MSSQEFEMLIFKEDSGAAQSSYPPLHLLKKANIFRKLFGVHVSKKTILFLFIFILKIQGGEVNYKKKIFLFFFKPISQSNLIWWARSDNI